MKRFNIIQSFIVITVFGFFSTAATASGGKPPSRLSQNVTCFALPDPIDKKIDKPFDVRTVEPSLIVKIEILEELGRIIVRSENGEKTYNGYLHKGDAKNGTALFPNLKDGIYEERKISGLSVSISSEPSPYPTIDLFVPSASEILSNNRDLTNAPYLTELTYIAQSEQGVKQSLYAVCYSSHAQP